ncbi:uncharacterized protein LOC120332033 [Styela clava]
MARNNKSSKMEVDEWEVESTSHCKIKLLYHVATFSSKEQVEHSVMKSSVHFGQSIRELMNLKDKRAIHGTNNESYRQSGISPTFLIELLQKVIHCLKYMHENEVGCEPIDSSCVYLSKDRRQIAIAKPAAGNNITNMESFARFALVVLSNGLVSDHENTSPTDTKVCELWEMCQQGKRVEASTLLHFLDKQNLSEIKCLTGFLCCKEPNLAFDLVMYIKKYIGKHEYDKILSHPFFWSESKKCQFICAVFGYFKREEHGFKKRYDDALRENYKMSGEFVFSINGWIESLKISNDELRKLIEKGNIVTSTTIYNVARREHCKEHSLFDFMRFFCNRYTHFFNDKVDIRHVFKNSSTGFWNFFASRYPRFLYYVYKKMWPHVKKYEEIRSIRECAPESTYLRTERTNKSEIPTTEVEEIQQEDELSLYDAQPYYPPASDSTPSQIENAPSRRSDKPEENYQQQKGLLKRDIHDARVTYDLVEVLYKHRDDKKEVICEAIKEISIQHYNLNDVNIKVFLTTISKLDKLEMLNVHNCGTPEYLNIFFKKLEMTNCKIAKISIAEMKNLEIYSQSLLTLLAKSETESLEFQAVELGDEDVYQLFEDINGLNSEYSLNVLSVSLNTKMGMKGFHKLGKILHILPVKTINLFDCDLTDDKLSELFGSLKHKQISTLDVSGNTKITHEGFGIIGQISVNSELKNLHMRCCELDERKLKSLQSSCQSNTKISKFDVSYNHTLGVEGMAELGRTVVNFEVKNLNIAGCALNKKLMEAFRVSIGKEKIMIKNLSLTANKNMGVEGLSSVGQILSNQSCVESLYLGDCDLSSDQLQAFKSSLGNNTEIKKLFLNNNTNMGVGGLSSVGQILSNQSCVEWLGLSDCNLSSDQLQAFKLLLGNNTEIDYLDMSEDNLPKYRANHEKIVAVANLLPNVTKKLWLQGWNITDEDEKILQNQLDEIGSEKLQISLYEKTLKCQKKDNEDEDKATNVILKQNPILSSKTEFGTTSRISNSESTEENREISKEAKSPRSELLMTEKEAEQSDKEVTEQAAKLTKPKTNITDSQIQEVRAEQIHEVHAEKVVQNVTNIDETNITYSQIQEVRAEQIHEVHAEKVVQNVTNIDETSITDSHIQEVRAEQIHAEKFVQNVTNIDGDTSSRTADVKRRRTSDGDSCSSPRSEILKTGTENIQQVDEPSLYDAQPYYHTASYSTPSQRSDKPERSSSDFVTDEEKYEQQIGLLKRDIHDARVTYDLVGVLYSHRDDTKEVICEAIKEISIIHYNLNDVNIKVFLTTISKLDKLEMLNVQNCGTSEYLNNFFEKLEKTNCKIAKISIWGMKNLKIYSKSLLKLLAKSETESLKIQAVELEDEDVDQLLEDIKSLNLEYSLSVLSVSHNTKMGLKGFHKFGEILHILPVKTINLFDCDLTDDKLSNLFGSLKHKQISTLDVSGNTKITHKGFKIIGQMSANSELRILHVRCCELDEAKLKGLRSSCKSNTKISKLDVSYNITLGSKGMAELGRTVINFEVENLNIAGCALNKKLVKKFRVSIGNKKIMVEELNISRNPKLENGIVDVALLLNRCRMKKVNMSKCMLSVENIHEFSSILGEKNIQIETLNISENNPTFIATRPHAEAVCELLRNVSKELIFKITSIKPQVRRILQHGLEKLSEKKKTKVILGNGDILEPKDRRAQPTTTTTRLE